MKRIILMAILSFMLLAAPSEASILWIYQENATAAACTGTWDVTQTCALVQDGNLATYGYSSAGSAVSFENYTKPSVAAGYNITDMKLYIRTTSSGNMPFTGNHSMVSNGCFNTNPIQVKMNSTTGAWEGNNVSCWTGAAWLDFQNTSSANPADRRLYETLAYWEITRIGPWLELSFMNTTNTTRTVTLSLVTVNATVQYTTDSLYFYLGNQSLSRINILLENQTITFDNANTSFIHNVTLLNGTVKWQKYKVVNTDSIGLGGAFVKVYDGVNRNLVFSGYSESDGSILVPINLQTAYWFEVTLTDYDNYAATEYVYDMADTTENIVMTKPSTTYDYWDYYDKVSAVCVEDNVTLNINCTATDVSTQHYVSQFCLNVAKITTTGYVTECYACNSTTTAGALGCTITSDAGNKTFTYQVTSILGDGSEYIVTAGDMSIMAGAVIYGLSGVFAGLIIILALSFIGLWSPVASMVLGTIGLIVSVWLGLFVISPAVVIGIVAVLGIIVIRSRY